MYKVLIMYVLCCLYVNFLLCESFIFWVEAWNEGGAQTKIKKDRGCVYQ
jgi:hypothetical protein